MVEYNSNARAAARVLKAARTITDLAGAEKIAADHVSGVI